MIIFNLIIATKEKADAVVDSILKNRFALNVVVGHAVDSYHLNSSHIKVHAEVYTIRFATKSVLFSEIEARLKKEFPDVDFYMMAYPIVHITAHFYDRIKNDVIGSNLIEVETEN
jgi:uncharacterized protein involved in tolerance to divalent cations